MFISVGCVERHGPGTGCSTVVHRIEKRRFVIEKSLNNRGKKGCQQYTSESFEKFDDHLKPCINEGCISQYYFLFFFGKKGGCERILYEEFCEGLAAENCLIKRSHTCVFKMAFVSSAASMLQYGLLLQDVISS